MTDLGNDQSSAPPTSARAGSTQLSVVIPTFDRSVLLERTLRSVASARRPETLGPVVVVENGPACGAETICRAVADQLDVTYLHHPEPGKGRALNVAADHVDDGFLLCLDDDVRIGTHTLRAYERAIESSDAVLLGGPVEVDHEESPPRWLEPFLPASVMGWNGPHDSGADENGYVLGANMLVHVDAVRAVGGFPVDRGPGAFIAGTEGNPVGMEFELQARLEDAGITAEFVPDAPVWHHVPADRCTADWALHRDRRRFLTLSLDEIETADEPTRRSHRRRARRLLARARVITAGSVVHPDPAFRHRARQTLARAHGMLDAHAFLERQS